MFSQRLFCCGGCSDTPLPFKPSLYIHSKTWLYSQSASLTKSTSSRAKFEWGEIVKLNENDSVPCLEVYVELENEHVRPESEFIYLHNVDVDFDEVLEE